MNAKQIEHTKGRYEYRPSAGAVLVLADPPEAGWLLENSLAQEVGRPLALPKRDRRPACDPVVPQRAARR